MPRHQRFRLVGLVPLVALLGSATTTSGATADETVPIRWHVSRDQVVELREELQLDGTITPNRSTAKDTKGLPLIYVFIGITTLPSLVSAIRTAIRDVVCGGVVVEDTGEELVINCEPSLGVGTVILRSVDGTRVERLEEVYDPSPLLDALARLTGSK